MIKKYKEFLFYFLICVFVIYINECLYTYIFIENGLFNKFMDIVYKNKKHSFLIFIACGFLIIIINFVIFDTIELIFRFCKYLLKKIKKRKNFLN